MRRTPSLLAGIVLVLLALGLVMLASASSVKGDASKNDPGYFLKRQAVASKPLTRKVKQLIAR